MLVLRHHPDIHDFIFRLKFRCRNGAFCYLEFASADLLDHALLCGKQQIRIPHLFGITDIYNFFLCTVVITDIVDRLSFITEFSIWEIHHFHLMHLPILCKNTDPAGIHAVQDVFIFIICCLFITLIRTDINRLCISETIHQEYDLLLFHFLLFKHSLFCILYNRTSLSCEFFLDTVQIFHDDCRHRIIIVQDIFISCDLRKCLLVLFLKCFNLQTDQFIEPHFQDRSCLTLCKP